MDIFIILDRSFEVKQWIGREVKRTEPHDMSFYFYLFIYCPQKINYLGVPVHEVRFFLKLLLQF